MRETIEAEALLADQLVCRAWWMVRSGSEWVDGQPLLAAAEGTIANPKPATPFVPGERGTTAAAPRLVLSDAAPDQAARIRAYPGLPAEVRDVPAVAVAIADAARGLRQWDAFQDALAGRLIQSMPPDAARQLAVRLRVALDQESRGIVLYARTPAPGPAP